MIIRATEERKSSLIMRPETSRVRKSWFARVRCKCRVLFLLVALGVSTLPGCVAPATTVPVSISSVETGTIFRIDPASYTVLGQGEGMACYYTFLRLIPLSDSAIGVQARKQAVQALGGDTLLDAKEDRSYLNFILVDRACATVGGTVIKFKEGKGPAAVQD